MNAIERYAAESVGAGALSYMEDDTDEDGEFPNRDDFMTARKLGIDMALAIQHNPQLFLEWYRSLSTEVKA